MYTCTALVCATCYDQLLPASHAVAVSNKHPAAVLTQNVSPFLVGSLSVLLLNWPAKVHHEHGSALHDVSDCLLPTLPRLAVDCVGEYETVKNCSASCDDPTGVIVQKFKVIQEPRYGGKACPEEKNVTHCYLSQDELDGCKGKRCYSWLLSILHPATAALAADMSQTCHYQTLQPGMQPR